jgi:RNA polymerase sigma factor for flagellar operon FliA
MPDANLNATWAKFLKGKTNLTSREELAKAYYYLVEAETRRLLARLPLRVYWEKKDDIASSGAIGLLQAIDHFSVPKDKKKDPGRAFEAYARYRIRGQMIDELRTLDFARRNLRKNARDIQEAEAKLIAENGRMPREEEIAKVLGVDLDELYDWIAEINMLNLLSLDAEKREGKGEGTWADSLVDTKAENALDKVEKLEKIEIVAESLKRLDLIGQKVLSLYYVENLTFREIGKILKISESRVCQIHHVSIFKLQDIVDRRGKNGGIKGRERVHDHRYGA